MMTPSISPGWPDANLGPGDVQGPRYDFVLEPCGQHSRSIGRGASSSVPQGGQTAPPRPNQRQAESTGRTQNFTVRFAKMGRSSSRIRR